LSATVVDVRGYEQGGQTKEGYHVVDAGDVVDIGRYGRLLSSNPEVVRGHCEDLQARRNVLKDTLLALGTEKRRRYYHDLAKENLQRWNREAAGTESLGDAPKVQLHKGDWGAVTLETDAEVRTDVRRIEHGERLHRGRQVLRGLARPRGEHV